MPIRDNPESDPKANPWSGPGAIPQACPLVRFEGHPLGLILGAVPKSIHLARPEANAWAVWNHLLVRCLICRCSLFIAPFS